MKKTFVIGFLGLFLVGGFLTGLYLISRPTNPPTSASEIVNPVQPPEGDVKVVPTDATFSFEKCQKLYGKTSQDADFDKVCDLDENGMINVIDLQKMK